VNAHNLAELMRSYANDEYPPEGLDDELLRQAADELDRLAANAALAWGIARALLAQRGEPVPDDPDKIRERYDALIERRTGNAS